MSDLSVADQARLAAFGMGKIDLLPEAASATDAGTSTAATPTQRRGAAPAAAAGCRPGDQPMQLQQAILRNVATDTEQEKDMDRIGAQRRRRSGEDRERRRTGRATREARGRATQRR